VEKLPEINGTILQVMEHYLPLAQSIHPEVTDSYILDRVMEFTRKWYEIEYNKAAERFRASIN
jgi:hypothetical protein